MKSILVIGMGKFGRHLSKLLLELGNEVMIIDSDEDKVNQYSYLFQDAKVGDCTNELVLKSLGVENFDMCIVAISDNFESSLIITELLKELGAKYIVSKANQDIQAELLTKIGANEVIYPERDIAERLAVKYSTKNVFDYIELTEKYAIYELPVTKKWVGRTIGELNIRKKYGVNIIGVKIDEESTVSPNADYVFPEDCHIIVVASQECIEKLKQ